MRRGGEKKAVRKIRESSQAAQWKVAENATGFRKEPHKDPLVTLGKNKANKPKPVNKQAAFVRNNNSK